MNLENELCINKTYIWGDLGTDHFVDIHAILNKLTFTSNVPGVVPVAMPERLLCVFLSVIGQSGNHQPSYRKVTDIMEVE